MACLWSKSQKERRKRFSSRWALVSLFACLFDGTQAVEFTRPTTEILQHHEFPSTRQLRSRPPKFPDFAAPTLPDITGPFELEVKLRLDAFDPSYNGYNTILSLSNGALNDAIYFGAFRSPNVISLLIYKNGQWNGVSATNVIMEGKETNFMVGVDADGTAWIDADGERVATAMAAVPDAVTRSRQFYGASPDFWNTRPLKGAILGLRITNKDENERDLLRRQYLSNLPGQLLSSFRASAYIKVDNTSDPNAQGILDIYTSDGIDNVRVVCVGRTMRFDLFQDNTVYSVSARNAVATDEIARWTIGVDSSNTMYIQKNEARLARTSIPRFTKILRRSTTFGNLASGNAALDGFVLGFRSELSP